MASQDSGKSILVVDDDTDVLETCARALSQAGYVVLAASESEQARQYIGHEDLDLVILDIHMPNEDGISLLKYAHEVNPELPAMLITGYAAVNTLIDAIRLDVREYLCKPFTLQKLLDAVELSLRERDVDRRF